ncbi:hypothetical protein M1413_03835 [Patescibacteria group bacterium]|nr:hypothetical protein [Patescibacteria group bacterium]MCL5114284.1 hypothetical protein [Patescibacteria group bacterium]
MVKVQNFSESLDKSLNRLGAEVSKKVESPEFKEAPIEHVVKESLRTLSVSATPPAAAVSAEKPRDQDPRARFLPSYLSDDAGDAEVKVVVENLVTLAFQSGVERAVAEAKRYPPFVEDAFHDALTEKLVPELRKRGIIK